MKHLKVLFMFAVFAAAVMVLAGCDSLVGTVNGNESASKVTPAPVFAGAGDYTGPVKEIKVRFEVKNGGMGLWSSRGIVSTQDDSHLVYNKELFANDYTIKIEVPVSDEYLNVRWMGEEWLTDAFVKAKMKAESGTITLDYNGRARVAVKNLYDVRVSGDSRGELYLDWIDASVRAGIMKERAQ